jgi:hypothetical protein
MMLCNVCHAELADPVYRGGENTSITTMNKVVSGQTRIFHCRTCDHVQTEELPDLARYYAEEYSINEDGVDDDQLYEIRDGKEIYRSEHQAGCSAVQDRSAQQSEGSRLWLREGGDPEADCRGQSIGRALPVRRYRQVSALLARLPKAGAMGLAHSRSGMVGHTGCGALVLRAGTHSHLGTVLGDIRALLRPGGLFYFIVPNLYANWADFIVADHVNHFSRGSLATMLARAGFGDIEIDDSSHASAFVVMCRRKETAPEAISDAPASSQAVEELARFWSTARQRISEQEGGLAPDARFAIYGAGIYGNFILSCLAGPDRVACFLDQNRFLQGKQLNGVPIVHPADVPDDVAAVFVGLNPLNARRIISSVESLKSRDIPCFFLN